MAEGEAKPKKNADLPVRIASALVMLVVAGTALWLGGWWLDIFIVAVAATAYAEFARLIGLITIAPVSRAAAQFAGAVYFAAAALALIMMSSRETLVFVVGSVIMVDTFAYFFGRIFGGPKIAPSISPSKTWAGLLGGVFGASLAMLAWLEFASANAMVSYRPPLEYVAHLLPAAAIAVLAQTGDFFESWLKRKAGVKDSSNLIPGHGGVFDRVDGLLPVAIFVGLGLWLLAPHWIAG